MNVHKQVAIKINGQCDEEVAPLVLALNEIPNLITHYSCQGEEGENAYVVFTIKGDWEYKLKVIHRIVDILKEKKLTFSVTSEWSSSAKQQFKLEVLQSDILSVANYIGKRRRNYKWNPYELVV